VLIGVGVLVVPAGPVVAQDAPAPPTTVAPPPSSTPLKAGGGAPAASGRQWLLPVPEGCSVPTLPDVVFVGTLLAKGTPAGLADTADNQTARFRLDQTRAGAVDRFTYNDVIDVRYGPDVKDLDTGEQYLVGASVDAEAGVLASKVREAEPPFGGDGVIAAAQQDLKCPTVADPVRTLHTDGTPVDDSIVKPLLSAKGRLVRAILLPLLAVMGLVFVLVAIRWLLTGAWKGAATVVRTASEPREVRAAMRSRPNVAPDLEDAERR
jgi:hypothetical protein